ncbi:MAG: helix-turn-helix domain-containing protein [Kangiellaceae bacterium]|nr:helix-turn-helix domain-containing protein [Kangiellaceae bacterium]MCW8998092.1 helix-turn-helix domain-containing protein [Kangiellaceae bacterium]
MEKNKNILMEKSEKIEKAVDSIMLELKKENKALKRGIGIRKSSFHNERGIELRDFLKNRLVTLCMEYEIGQETLSEGESKPRMRGDFITALDKILESYYSNSSTKVRDIASSLAMSERQLYRKIKNCLNLTPSEYLKLFRLKKAKCLLSRGGVVNSVAFEVGFNSHAYFSRCFKTQFGKLPSEFKRRGETAK